jgi:hypothetical protein
MGGWVVIMGWIVLGVRWWIGELIRGKRSLRMNLMLIG